MKRIDTNKGKESTNLKQQDIDDIKTVLNEQSNLIDQLTNLGCQSVLSQSICDSIKDCNKVMMEIVCGPVGGIEKLVEKTNDWNYTKPIVGLDENGQPITIDSWAK
jgi:hypothetical protein